jgi:hypothetical protein
MDQSIAEAVKWLLASDEPAIRMQARRDLLDEPVEAEDDRILSGAKVSALLSGQQANGGFGVHPYSKWTGAHWRLVSLVELAVPAGEPRALAAADHVLGWVRGFAERGVPVVDGLARRCASQEGNALAACSRLGMAGDERVRALAASLISWQWPDGGWNCDKNATGCRSSFHETLAPAWGLHEYAQATGDRAAGQAADRAAELFLEHRLFRSLSTGKPVKPAWLALHYPPYWHYDILHALLVLSRMGKATDPRAGDALDELQRRQLADGRWRPGSYWWRPAGQRGMQDVVDWGRSGPNEMITLNALRVLRAAGRVS